MADPALTHLKYCAPGTQGHFLQLRRLIIGCIKHQDAPLHSFATEQNYTRFLARFVNHLKNKTPEAQCRTCETFGISVTEMKALLAVYFQRMREASKITADHREERRSEKEAAEKVVAVYDKRHRRLHRVKQHRPKP